MSGQNVDDNRRRRGAFAQSFGTGGFHCIQPISRDHAQDLHHLAVAVWRVAKLALDTPYRRWQFPFLEGRTIAQGAWLAGENRDVVQWVIDGLVAPKSADVLPDDLAVLPKLDTLSIGADLNRPTNGATVNRVTVFVEPDQAGLRDGCRHGMEAIKRADVWHQAGALGLEHFPDCLVSKLLMWMGLGPCQATVLKPCVKIGITLETRSRHEEPSPDYANLVLDLSLLPAGRRGAGDRLDKVMAAHLLETPIISTVTANKDRVYRSLHIVVNSTGTGTAEENERLVMGIEDHLLRLSRIGSHKQHPAVAQSNMGHLHGRRHTVYQHDLMAPVELIGFARIKTERNICGCRRFLFFLGPCSCVTSNGIVATTISKSAEFLKDPDTCEPVPLRFARIRSQHLVKVGLPGPDLWLWLDAALVCQFRDAGPDHLPHRVPRHPQLTADLLDRLLVLKVCPPDLRYRLHDQHPNLCSLLNSGASST